MMANTKTEPMVEHRVTVVVRYPLTGAVPAIGSTVESIVGLEFPRGSVVEITEMRAKTVRVPVSENGAGK